MEPADIEALQAHEQILAHLDQGVAETLRTLFKKQFSERLEAKQSFQQLARELESAKVQIQHYEVRIKFYEQRVERKFDQIGSSVVQTLSPGPLQTACITSSSPHASLESHLHFTFNPPASSPDVGGTTLLAIQDQQSASSNLFLASTASITLPKDEPKKAQTQLEQVPFRLRKLTTPAKGKKTTLSSTRTPERSLPARLRASKHPREEVGATQSAFSHAKVQRSPSKDSATTMIEPRTETDTASLVSKRTALPNAVAISEDSIRIYSLVQTENNDHFVDSVQKATHMIFDKRGRFSAVEAALAGKWVMIPAWLAASAKTTRFVAEADYGIRLVPDIYRRQTYYVSAKARANVIFSRFIAQMFERLRFTVIPLEPSTRELQTPNIVFRATDELDEAFSRLNANIITSFSMFLARELFEPLDQLSQVHQDSETGAPV